MNRRILFVFAAAAALFAGCDELDALRGRPESGAAYRAAMADYTAGRLDAAEKGFLKAIREDPSDANARFQLACLLQDRKRDLLGAICCYREYSMLDPSGDKIELAKARSAICEKELAKELAAKYAGAAASAESDETRRKFDETKTELEKAKKTIADKAGRVDSLERENARLRKMLAMVGEEPQTNETDRDDMKKLIESLDEEDEEEDRIVLPGEFAPEPADDRSAAMKLVASMLAEEDEDGSPATLPDRRKETAEADDGKKLSNLMKAGRNENAEDGIDRPEWYVVQEGDTLYRIAIRFYGRMSAWSRIRDANKATISTDGRIRAGQKIKLP